MEMDIDQEFDDFELDTDDILVLQQEEEIYLSSQQTHTADSQLMWAPPMEPASTNKQPHSILPFEQTSTKSRALIEAEQTIENLRFRLHRSELTHANNDNEYRKIELNEVKTILGEKDRDILRLKQELARLKEQDDAHQKRPFPGMIPDSQKRSFPGMIPDSQKPRRTIRPSPFLKPLSSFSQSPSPQSQRQSTPQPNKEVEGLITPPSPSTTSMPTLMSMASHIKLPSPINATKKPKVPQPKKTGSTETEKNNKLLIVLFTPLFQQWNYQNHENKKDIHVCLTRSNIRYFSERFSQQLVPDRKQCSSTEHFNHLILLASDISNHLIKSEYAHSTIRLLLNVLNLSLQICIKERIFNVIQRIVTILIQLSTSFSITRKYLMKDLKFDRHSILTQLTKSIELFRFDKQKKCLLLLEVPDIQHKSMTDIIRLSETYSTTPTELLHRLKQTDTPKESLPIVNSILELFYSVGSLDEKPIFDFLMEESSFLTLLYPTTPYKVIIAALSVLETNFLDDVYMESYKDQNLMLVNCLADLIVIPQGSSSFDQWFELRYKAMCLLHCMTLVQPSSTLFVEMFKVIFRSTNLALEEMTKAFNQHRKIDSVKNRKQHDKLVKIGLETMYNIIMNYPEDIFKYVSEPKPNYVLDYVQFFRSKGIDENHPANTVLSNISKYFDAYFLRKKK